jgi:hypothetical protein
LRAGGAERVRANPQDQVIAGMGVAGSDAIGEQGVEV